jgi:dihydroorotate dehydrogenase electron transfer subunit
MTDCASSGNRGQFRCTVVANVPLCREHYRLVLGLPSFPATEPGQFIQVSCNAPDEGATAFVERELECQGNQLPQIEPHPRDPLATRHAMLRRPFSLAGRRDQTPADVELDLIHRVVGVGTEYLARLAPGDVVDILGPLGNRFPLPPRGTTAVLVGGGVGIPPMLYLAEALARAGRPGVAFCGAVSRDLLPLTITQETREYGPEWHSPLDNIAEFSRHGIPSVVTTDDGSYGFRGFVTQALERFLEDRGRAAVQSPVPVLYTCGPEPMMKRVADIAAARGLECQVAVERAMACGMGTCQSCCIRVRKPDPAEPPLPGSDWCYRLACTDGPVFRGADLLW